MTVSQVSYGGIYLPQTTAAAVAWAQANLNPAQLTEFYAPSWPGHQRTHLPFTGPCFPPFQIGTLHWPQGASRFAVAHFFITDSQLSELRNYIYSPGHHYYASRPLVMADDLGGTITTPMYLLPPHPLAQLDRLPTPLKQLYLMTLVDARYFWWEVPAALPVVAGTTTWIQLLASISTALAVPITVGAIPTAYLKPPASLTSYYEWLPLLLDAVCACIGQRLIRKLDGTVETQLATVALTKQRAQFTTFGTKLQAGGHLLLDAGRTPNDLNGLVPAKVGVSFTPSSGDVQDPRYFSEATLTDLALPEFRAVVGYPSTHLFHDSALFSGSHVTPDNQVELDDLAEQIATDFYRWRLGFVEAKWPGMKAWVPGGLEDVVEWIHGEGEVSTRVYRGAWNGEPFQLCHQSSVDTEEDCCAKFVRPLQTFCGTVPGTTATGTAVLTADVVTSITITQGGLYTLPPMVLFSGDGTGAAGTAVLAAGAVVSVTIDNGGSGYTVPPLVTFTAAQGGFYPGVLQDPVGTDRGFQPATPFGTPVSAGTQTVTPGSMEGLFIGQVVLITDLDFILSEMVTITGTDVTARGTGTFAAGLLTGGTITQGGSGYLPAAGTIGFITTGGGGAGGTGTAVVAGGVVTGPITITNPGSGYTSTPTLVFPDSPATATTFTATFFNTYADGIRIRTEGVWLRFANAFFPTDADIEAGIHTDGPYYYLCRLDQLAGDGGRVFATEMQRLLGGALLQAPDAVNISSGGGQQLITWGNGVGAGWGDQEFYVILEAGEIDGFTIPVDGWYTLCLFLRYEASSSGVFTTGIGKLVSGSLSGAYAATTHFEGPDYYGKNCVSVSVTVYLFAGTEVCAFCATTDTLVLDQSNVGHFIIKGAGPPSGTNTFGPGSNGFPTLPLS